MRAFELLRESPADEISDDLNQLGLTDQRRESSKTISVYVPAADRQQVMQDLLTKLPDSEHDRNFTGSSLGAIRYKEGTIRIRPKGKAGMQSAGLGNEAAFIDGIRLAIEQAGGPIDIEFTDGTNTWSVQGVQSVKGVGADTSGRKKADVTLATKNGAKGVSIKKGNAQYWESADTFFGKQADELITKLEARGDIELIPLDKQNSAGVQFVKLSNEIAVPATDQEIIDIIFGNDLQGQNGAILKQTFMADDFVLNGDKLKVNCKVVIVEPDDIPMELEPIFFIRNDSSRGRPAYKYPGIRVTAAYRSRITRNTITVRRR